MFVDLPQWLLPSDVWLFLALFGAMMTTYSKAAAKEKGFVSEIKGGLMSRVERLAAYGIILILLILGLKEWATAAVVILVILTNFTAGQRIGKTFSS